jgi:hypothetical protein
VVLESPQPSPSEGGIIGEHGVVIWRSSYYVEKGRFGASGWMYVVYFPGPNTYDAVEESRLTPIEDTVPLASCLGRDFEISYDRQPSGQDAICGTFRVPGGFWNIFIFHSEAVEELSSEIRIPVRFYSGGIAKYDFSVPRTDLLDCQFIEEAMSKIFDAQQWHRIAGPESRWFC